VVTSPELVQSAFKISKTLSFDPIFINASKRVFNIDTEKMKILTRRPTNKKDEYPIAKDVQQAMHNSMAAGTSLLQMNARALNSFAVYLNEIDTTEKLESFYDWIRHCFTVASAEALYGPENPVSENNDLIQSLL
jgi:hypothetical protein